MSPIEQVASVAAAGLPPYAEELWPEAAWAAYRDAGVLRWTIPRACDGDEFPADQVLAGCIELARIDLKPAFVLSQFQSAVTRFVATENRDVAEHWLPGLATGEAFGTVGISHLTTSRQHTSRPAVLAEPSGSGYRVSGEIPWVTGGRHADVLVAGASLADGSQILFALPKERAGFEVAAHWTLLALTGSETGPVRLEDVLIHKTDLLAGPAAKVMQQGTSGGTGSLTTSALAIGHALGCIDRLAEEARSRPVLEEIVSAFRADAEAVRGTLLQLATGQAAAEHTSETLRTRATSLALSTSQALLTASKGAGFVSGHPAERLAREAMFFLVWSCPQAVSNQLLREFSQCEEGGGPIRDVKAMCDQTEPGCEESSPFADCRVRR